MGKGLSPSINMVARLDFAEGSKALKEVGKQAKGMIGTEKICA